MVSVIFFNCKEETKQEHPLLLERNSDHTQITFQNTLKNTPQLNILNYLYYYNGAGVSIADVNNDSLPDLYFVSNEGADKLYLNKGNLQFEDITEASKIDNSTGWTTGVTNIDINNDGLMDFYICKVGKHLKLKGHNLLYINAGIQNGIPRFEEQSETYGLDISSYATQSVFLDYDLDGDLDMYLLNHSVYPNANYGKGSTRSQVDSLSGDRLLENRNGKYVDVSVESKIFQGKIGYGLGVSVGDINDDGYPDLYIGNDFFENDYLYINQKDKTFKEVISSENNLLGHTTHYSMGNAITDLNNDARPDILSLDMLPENLHNYKTSGLEFSFPVYHSYLRNGYQPQYMQNTLHLNAGSGQFSEVGHLSGLAATEWSWSALAFDIENDGKRDLYITNGIVGATNDMDFINFISNEQIQAQLGDTTSRTQMKFIDKLPSKKVSNYVFKNKGDSSFEDMSKTWTISEPSYSSGSAYADLDNDGDLDIVVNNVNGPAFIIENKSNEMFAENNSLQVRFNGDSLNINGIGAKVKIFKGDEILSDENYNTRGFLSSVAPTLHFGLGEIETVDSISVIWPNGKFESLYNVSTKQNLTFNIQNAKGNYYEIESTEPNDRFSIKIKGVDFVHSERTSLDFNRDPLVPYANSNEGPDLAVADFNRDGLEDFFISGAKAQASVLYKQLADGTFKSVQEELFSGSSLNEDISQTFADLNNDGWLDLIVASGGNEFKEGNPISPRIYYNNKGVFTLDKATFQKVFINASKVLTKDLNADGYLDILFLADATDLVFGKTPQHYLFLNDKKGGFIDGTKTVFPDINEVGNVKDALFVDIDKDGDQDLILAGHWMPITILMNENGKCSNSKLSSLSKTNGWWNTLKVEDFDKDGDLDIVAGNWGLNSRLKASAQQPITLYTYDFDENGKSEPLVTFFYQDVETPFASKDEIAKQLPYINKKYLSYSDFADATIDDIFGRNKLNQAEKKYVYELASCYFENTGNLDFKKKRLPNSAQVSSVNEIFCKDFNNDGLTDLFLTGNNFEISTQLSRLDASHGELLLFENNKDFISAANTEFPIWGVVRSLAPISINQSNYLIVARNNDSPLFLKLESSDDENE
ncbi:Repeat domain-containing protein [Flavobacteriaceae bacterium MAR_2010_188]|nr:Repeat domain-containing protein [Flavobacteriaceae bacterium MAR_2010_188]